MLAHAWWLPRLARSSFPARASAARTLRISSSPPPPAAPAAASAGPGVEAAGDGPSRRAAVTLPAACALAGASLLGGYLLGSPHSEHWEELNRDRELPRGERGCCSCDAALHSHAAAAKPDFTEAQSALSSKLRKIVGKDHVYDRTKETSKNVQFLKGARLGHGTALCVVQPVTLEEAVMCLKEIVDAGCVVLPQGSNTGLTGGSVPRNDTQDKRPAVVLSMRRLDTHFPIDGGHRVVCLAGCGILTLANSIQSWFPNRESHSFLGSTFLNPTTAAGVAFGSGGAYVRKGPARTDRALYCKVSKNKWGENVITVVNTLGIKGLEDADFQEHTGQDAVGALDAYANDVRQGFQRPMMASSASEHGRAKASDTNYKNAVCEFNGDVSRYNADLAGEDCNRSEGKVVILATVHDTFPVPKEKRVFWVSFPDMEMAMAYRKEVCLDNPTDLPISCEYMNRDSVDIIDRSGRIGTHMIRYLGQGDILSFLWSIKLGIEGLPFSWAPVFCDKMLHIFNNWVPAAIPGKFMAACKGWDHHCVVAVGEFGDGTMDRFIERMDAFVKKHNDKMVVDEKGANKQPVLVVEAESPSEMAALNAFRFVAALAFKTYCIGEDIQGLSVDYALPKNGGLAPPLAPGAAIPLKRMRYSHFGCNVVHEDIAYALGVDTHKEKVLFKHNVEEEGGKMPAEHGHGTEYHAPESSQERWMKMDPENVLNPGVGGLSTLPKYGN